MVIVGDNVFLEGELKDFSIEHNKSLKFEHQKALSRWLPQLDLRCCALQMSIKHYLHTCEVLSFWIVTAFLPFIPHTSETLDPVAFPSPGGR